MHIYGKENFQLAVSDSENELYIFKLNLRAKETIALCPLQILNISCIFSTVRYRFSSLNINLQQLMI